MNDEPLDLDRHRGLAAQKPSASAVCWRKLKMMRESCAHQDERGLKDLRARRCGVEHRIARNSWSSGELLSLVS